MVWPQLCTLAAHSCPLPPWLAEHPAPRPIPAFGAAGNPVETLKRQEEEEEEQESLAFNGHTGIIAEPESRFVAR